MAETGRCALGNQLDIEQILSEAQHRWLRPAEICEILQNYKNFQIAPEPPNMPPSGSLFLFDRKVLRYFRKDGHTWRKKNDGKTVKEAHEKLKAGSIDVLHCYYAHGEENENFQRRCYWMLEEELSHIVLVHYREVKGNRTNYNRIKQTEVSEVAPNSDIDSSGSSSFPANNYQRQSQATDSRSLNSAQASVYEDAESACNQASSGFHSFCQLQQPMVETITSSVSDGYHPISFSNDYQEKFSAIPMMSHSSLAQAGKKEGNKNAGVDFEPRKNLQGSWENNLENTTAGFPSLPFQPSFSTVLSDNLEIIPKHEDENLGQLFAGGSSEKQEFDKHLKVQEEWQATEGNSFGFSKWPIDQNFPRDSGYDLTSGYLEQEVNGIEFLQMQHPKKEHEYSFESDLGNATLEGKPNYISGLKNSLLDGSFNDDGLKKLDSFNRWMNKELGDVESHMQTSSGACWDTLESENGIIHSNQIRLDNDMLGPSLSQDQLFSIIDFSPNCAYENSELKVLITGRFLNTNQIKNCKWSCMFGELEVPAEVIADGVLRCYAPIHKAGRVPFYVTRTNRLACSEVREFEYRANLIQDVDTKHNSGCTAEMLKLRFGKILMQSSGSPNCDSISMEEKLKLSSKINPLMSDSNDEWDQMLKLTSEDGFSLEGVQEQLHQKLLKDKLQVWLLQKMAEGGKGPSVLDEGGQGVLHFAAALGYDWALKPTIVAGANVNFRDVNGWTALHWAAFCGREHTVAVLMSLGAAPGALIDPSPKYPSGKTPADLASAEGHKGIAGYLAESQLTDQLKLIDLNAVEAKAAGSSGVKVVQTAYERTATPTWDDGLTDRLSLKDSLAAVRNATQAAARIHQVFRVQSFQRKQLKEYGDNKFGMSDERTLSLFAVKTHKARHHDEDVHAAAIRIQNKFRSWKGRKEFLIIRQRIVKIQAHVRGHQVRKNYRKIIWSVGILDKVILRWRRKGSGLRGFKKEAPAEIPIVQTSSSKDNDEDFLKEGRKQTEERLQKALARVKSMVQYPEAREQYRRLLNVVTEMQETKQVKYDRVLNSSEDTGDFDDDIIDIDALLDEDTFMPTATW